MRWNATLTLILILGAAMSVVPAAAGPATDALSKCLADSTTGKDRKDMVRWFFTSLSVHPDIQDLSNVSEATRTTTDKNTAAIIERLITQACREQSRTAFKTDGPDAMRASFKTLGELAAYELMANPSVSKAVSAFSQHLDTAKINDALK